MIKGLLILFTYVWFLYWIMKLCSSTFSENVWSLTIHTLCGIKYVVLTLILIKGGKNFLECCEVLYNQDKFESSIEFKLSCKISLYGIHDMVFCFILLAVLITYMSELAEKKKSPDTISCPLQTKKNWLEVFI